jgi:hypothetical protein
MRRPHRSSNQESEESLCPGCPTCPPFLPTSQAAFMTTNGPCSDVINPSCLRNQFQSYAAENLSEPSCSMDQSWPSSKMIHPARFATAETAPPIAAARPYVPPEQALSSAPRASWGHASEPAGDAAFPRGPGTTRGDFLCGEFRGDSRGDACGDSYGDFPHRDPGSRLPAAPWAIRVTAFAEPPPPSPTSAARRAPGPPARRSPPPPPVDAPPPVGEPARDDPFHDDWPYW